MSRTKNAVLTPSDLPFGAPRFDKITAADYLPAFKLALEQNKREIARIAGAKTKPTFANTIAALEKVGAALDRVNGIFWNLAATNSSDELRKIQRLMSPKLAAHSARITTNGRLFKRVDAVFANQFNKLDAEQKQVLEKQHRGFVMGGAKLDAADRKRFMAIRQELASLGTTFTQNILKDETDWVMWLTEKDLAGLPEFLVSSAKSQAKSRGKDGYAITLSRSSIEPFLVFSERRDLRKTAYQAWTSRGDAGATDTKPLISRTLQLRHELAQLLGYANYAEMKLSDTMAKTPKAARSLLEQVWKAGRNRAADEEKLLTALAAKDGIKKLEAWDWRHYAEKQRQIAHALDEAELKPYFQLEQMIEASFDCATRLFGLKFRANKKLPTYHPDVRVWEVLDAKGKHVALFYGDYFARPGKQSGAWMSDFRSQQKLAGDIRPIIVNVMNFSKPEAGKPALLSFDDARTLFHEFGHALHGMLSDVTYPSLAGTNVPRDFVELPSQLYEHWLEQPEILQRYALHAKTGKPLPAPLLKKLLAARNFNQGFMTVEYCASALVDMTLHETATGEPLDVAQAERDILASIKMPRTISMRHRTPHFSHVFSGEGYSAGYYSYLWSEVLDADAFEAFRETGDIFDKQTAAKLKTHIYAAGNRLSPDASYIAFRGRLPDSAALLRKRGLAAKAA